MRLALTAITLATAALPAFALAEPQQEQLSSTPAPEPKAEDQSQPLGTKQPEWKFQFEPSAWYAGASGKVRIAGAPSNAGTVQINDLHLDNPRLTPAGELHVRTGNWRFSFGTFFFSQNRLQTMDVGGQLGTVTFAPGNQVYSKMEQNEYVPVVGYEFWNYYVPKSTNGVEFLGRLEAFGGARLDDMEFSFAQGANAASQSEFFGQAIIGVKGSMDIAEQFSIDLETSVGGWPGGNDYAWSWDITVGFMWRPIPNVGVQVGYRNLVNELRSGSDSERFYYNGGLAGLFFGAVVRF